MDQDVATAIATFVVTVLIFFGCCLAWYYSRWNSEEHFEEIV